VGVRPTGPVVRAGRQIGSDMPNRGVDLEGDGQWRSERKEDGEASV
jgi:hypothetical protein